jgi:hypothetical protein
MQREVDQLIDLQITTLKQESSLSSAQLREYHLRSEKIQTLCEELDRIKRSELASKFANAS